MEHPEDNESSRPDPLDVRVGRILNEFLDRRARGDSVDEAELLADNPDVADELRGYLNLLEDFEPGRQRVARLVTLGLLRPSDDARYLGELGPYRICGLIGQGGMGIVLKAYEEGLKRTIALKILRPELAGNEVAINRFAREAQAAAALRHPNIVTVHAVGEELDTHFIVMELVGGPSLADVIRKHAPLPPNVIREIFRQLMDGLAGAHEAGLVHRDIKPSNILLDGWQHGLSADAPPPFTAKIGDFGLARVLSSQTQLTIPNSTLGTPEYMSPEQARGDENIDHRTDLWASGVVLYEMLTGRTPFRADRPSAVVHRILHVNPADPRSLADGAEPDLASLAIRLMAKRREDRFASAQDVLAALEAGQPVRSIENRRRAAIRATLGLAAVIVLAIATWLSLSVRANGPIRSVVLPVGAPQEVEVKRGDSTVPKLLYRFGDGEATVKDAKPLDRDGDGAYDLVVACLQQPYEDAAVFGISTEGRLVWRWDPTPGNATTSGKPIRWPEYGSDPTRWVCEGMLVEDLDSKPGDELVVVAREGHGYACRVSLLAERDNEVEATSTFWHIGHLRRIRSVELPQGDRLGILAWGVNNKLGGFRDPNIAFASELPLASYDLVPVVAVLDPARMDGLGPPFVASVDLPQATPVAYAYLDLVERDAPSAEHTGAIRSITDCPYLESSTPQGCLNANVYSCELGRTRHRATIEIDHNLAFRKVVANDDPVPFAHEGQSLQDTWRAKWHVINQNRPPVRP